MAVNAANFTFTYQNRPSILEIIAHNSLNESLHPAFQRLALVLSTNIPHKFGWLNYYFEETYVVLNGLLQYYYLAYYDASFSENFYGLKRLTTSDKAMTKKHRELSLIFLVAIPYFKRKLDEKINIIKIENAEGSLKNDLEGTMRKYFMFMYSTFESLYGLLSTYNYIKYMAHKTDCQTPIYKLIETKLIYNTDMEDYSGFWTSLFKGGLSLSQISFGLIRNGVATTLEVGAFFLQFLNMWNSQKANYNLSDLPNVPAPKLDNKAKQYAGKCPICLKSWVIPTVLQVSGYIFCFRCILRQLNEHHKCPVTNLPARPLDIVRLYIS